MNITFVIKEDFPYFDGHFPGNPIVPAVIQIGWIKILIDALVGEPVGAYRLSRFKFILPLRPLASIRISVKRTDQKYACRIYADEGLCCSGTFSLQRHV